MTEPAGRQARWAAPLVLAPCAAAVFGASMWWAGGATPTTAATPSPPAPTTAPGPTAGQLWAAAQAQAHREALAAAVTREQHAAVALQHRLTALGRQLRHVSAADDAQHRVARSTGGGGYAAGSSGSNSVSSGGSSGGSGLSAPVAVAPAPVAPQPVYVAPAPPPAPPVQATTGASGKP